MKTPGTNLMIANMILNPNRPARMGRGVYAASAWLAPKSCASNDAGGNGSDLKVELRGKRSDARGFTLIELLVVISIISVLVAFTVVSLGGINKTKKISTARGELQQIETALANYKAKYGVYPPANQNPNGDYTPGGQDRSQLNQLYYELSGTVATGAPGNPTFVTLSGDVNNPGNIPGTFMTGSDVQTAFAVGGFINCTKGGGEETQAAQNFLPSLSTKMYNIYASNRLVQTTILVTSVGGPDDSYQPLGASGMNPFRYVYPGTNNPNSYDLWVQLSISGKKYLVCNWNNNAQVNTTNP
jgi:prepilin-type N-terminal cleavage/methylation domain-containing protein